MVILGHTRTNVYVEYLENKRSFQQRVQNASNLLKKVKIAAGANVFASNPKSFGQVVHLDR